MAGRRHHAPVRGRKLGGRHRAGDSRCAVHIQARDTGGVFRLPHGGRSSQRNPLPPRNPNQRTPPTGPRHPPPPPPRPDRGPGSDHRQEAARFQPAFTRPEKRDPSFTPTPIAARAPRITSFTPPSRLRMSQCGPLTPSTVSRTSPGQSRSTTRHEGTLPTGKGSRFTGLPGVTPGRGKNAPRGLRTWGPPLQVFHSPGLPPGDGSDIPPCDCAPSVGCGWLGGAGSSNQP